MSHHQDGVSEIITHFIGQFHISVEDMRLRQEFEPGTAPLADAVDAVAFPEGDSLFLHRLEIPAFLPEVHYVAPQFEIAPADFEPVLDAQRVDVGVEIARLKQTGMDVANAGGGGGDPEAVAQGPVPGSTVLIGFQHSVLHDDDFVKLGDSTVSVPLWQTQDSAALDSLHGQAAPITAPFTAIDMVKNVSDVSGFVEAAAGAIAAYPESAPDGQTSVFIGQGPVLLEGRYSNGASVDALPVLDISVQELLDNGPSRANDSAQRDHEAENARTIDEQAEAAGTMVISSGGNVQINETVLVNAGLTGNVLTVAGDVHQLDAIVQVNAISDGTLVNGDLPNGFNITETVAAAQNSAQFSHETAAPRALGPTQLDVFPETWQVSVVEGDVIFLNWVVQYNFASDQDTLVLTATGSHASVTTGENIALNGLNFADIGKFYDHIYIGGSLYDANLIIQTNILVNHDIVDALNGFNTGHGEIAAGGNVQWNEAAINNTGPGQWQPGVPAHYAEAAAVLDHGPGAMPDGYKSDAAFEGLAVVKVLYIKGNLYDLQFVQQTNILTDSDHLALYEQQLQQAQDLVWQDAQWSVSTGGNTQMNAATIHDYDSLGDLAHVGGTVYSDAILVQAEIVTTPHDLFTPSGEQLISEAIAFLDTDDDDGGELTDLPDAIVPMAGDAGSPDILQSYLS